METKKINIKSLFLLTIPIFFELILQILLGNVDKIMVRNDASANAINQANSIIDTLTVFIAVLASSSLILINQYKGAKNKEKENKVYSLAFFFNLFLSITIGLLLFIFSSPILKLMNISEESFNGALLYLRINSAFLFLQGIILTTSAFLRSNELVLQGFIVSTIFNILNVILNALFLYVLHIPGITGVAVATVISRTVGVIILLIILFKKTAIKLSLPLLFKTKGDLKKLLKISVPSAGESLSYSLSQIFILTIINIIGLEINKGAPTAKTYTYIMIQFSSIFTSSVSQAMQIMLGRYLGAKDLKLAEKIVNITLILAISSSIFIALIQAVLSRQIFQIFTKDELVIDLCIKIMWLDVLLEIGRATNITLVRALQTNGDVIFPTSLSIFFCWVVAITGSYLLGITLKVGIVGVWISMTIDELSRGFIFILRFKIGKWKSKNLILE